jgi:hypothetical protein
MLPHPRRNPLHTFHNILILRGVAKSDVLPIPRYAMAEVNVST